MTKNQKQKIYNYIYNTLKKEYLYEYKKDLFLGIVFLIFWVCSLISFFFNMYKNDVWKLIIVGSIFFWLIASILKFLSAYGTKIFLSNIREFINFNGGELCKISKMDDIYRINIGHFEKILTNEDISKILFKNL